MCSRHVYLYMYISVPGYLLTMGNAPLRVIPWDLATPSHVPRPPYTVHTTLHTAVG